MKKADKEAPNFGSSRCTHPSRSRLPYCMVGTAKVYPLPPKRLLCGMRGLSNSSSSGGSSSSRKRPRAGCSWGLLGFVAVCSALPVAVSTGQRHIRWIRGNARGLKSTPAAGAMVNTGSSSFTYTASSTASTTTYAVTASSTATATFTADGPDGDDDAVSSDEGDDDGDLEREEGENGVEDDSSREDGDGSSSDDGDSSSSEDDDGDASEAEREGNNSADDGSASSDDAFALEDGYEGSSSGTISATGSREDSERYSLIKVLAPIEGEVLDPAQDYQVVWEIDDDGDDEEEAGLTQFHVDLYDCGQDESCGGGCGNFVEALCADEGCGSHIYEVSIRLQETILDGTGPFYTIVVSDDGSSDAGCSGMFTVAGGSSSVDSDVVPVEDDGNATSEVVLEVCKDLDGIPSPLTGDFVVTVASGVTEVVCDKVKTVDVSGGTLTVAAEHGMTVVFSGIRFAVGNAATLAFTAKSETVFTGVVDLGDNGGILSVEAGGTVDMEGLATFHDNSVKAGINAAYNGGAIYNNGGTVWLLGGAKFTGNFVVSSTDGASIGDGGAVWNGPGSTMVMLAAELEGNGVGAGGRAGGLWNEGYVEVRHDASFMFNEAASSGDSSINEGIGGGMFNHRGKVRFKGSTNFSGNEAQAGSAFVNSGRGKVVMHAAGTTIHDNVSEEEDGSIAGAVWNQADCTVIFKDSVSWEGNRGYDAAGMLNSGKVIFRGQLSVRHNTAVMDGGGFINGSGATMVFHDGAEFLSNVGTGYGGAILNHAYLLFKGVDGIPFTLDFEDNYCGEQEDIQNKSGSNVDGIEDVADLCAIGSQEIMG